MSLSGYAWRDSYLDAMNLQSSNTLSKSSLTWTIKKYSKLNLKIGEELVSPKFRINGMDKTFYLSLYSRGFMECSKDYVAVYLCSDSNDAVEIDRTISVVNVDGTGEDYIKFFHEPNFRKFSGWCKFISKEELRSKKSQLYPNDELTLVCVVTSPVKMPKFHWKSIVLERHSTSELQKESVTCVISDFNKRGVTSGEPLNSGLFTIRGVNKKFQLKLYPLGETEEDKDYIAVYLLSDSWDIMSVSFTITIVDIHDRNDGLRRNLVRICNFNSGWGWSRFVSRKELESRFLQNDVLTLTCVINLTDHIVDKEIIKDLYDHNAASSDDLLIQDWSTPRDNKRFTDAALKSEEIRPTSKFLLNLRKTRREKENKIKDVAKDMVFTELLNLMLDLDSADLKLKLLSAAHKETYPVLQDGCFDYLDDKMSEANVISIGIKADRLGDHELYAKCLDFISRKMSSVTFLSKCYEELSNISRFYDMFIRKGDMTKKSSCVHC